MAKPIQYCKVKKVKIKIKKKKRIQTALMRPKCEKFVMRNISEVLLFSHNNEKK